jgi:hypothetical protein
MSAKHSRDSALLTAAAMRSVLSQKLPRRNGYMEPDLPSLLQEALTFGVKTRGQFRRLISRHRKERLGEKS